MGQSKPKCQLSGRNGNIFCLMGIAGNALEEAGMKDKAKEMCKRITGGESKSYDQSLQIIMEYVDAS